jgi:hypothetical protein
MCTAAGKCARRDACKDEDERARACDRDGRDPPQPSQAGIAEADTVTGHVPSEPPPDERAVNANRRPVRIR